MNTYPALDVELEKSLKEDHDGAFLRDFQRTLRDFHEAVDAHIRDGVDKELFAKWRDLQNAAGVAGEVAVKLRNHLLQT